MKGIERKIGRARWNSAGMKKGKAGSARRRVKRANKKMIRRAVDAILGEE